MDTCEIISLLHPRKIGIRRILVRTHIVNTVFVRVLASRLVLKQRKQQLLPDLRIGVQEQGPRGEDHIDRVHDLHSQSGTGQPQELGREEDCPYAAAGDLLHERQRVRSVERAVAVLRDRDLRRAKALPDGERDDGRVVIRDLLRVGVHLCIERLGACECVGVVLHERRDLHTDKYQYCERGTASEEARVLTASPMLAKRVQKYELRFWIALLMMTYCTTGSRTCPTA